MHPSEPPGEETALHRWVGVDGPLRPVAVLRWSDDNGQHERVVEERTVVGYAAENGIAIADRTVSRIHAAIDFDGDGLWIRDLGSRNGTYVDDVFIRHARIGDGARIRLGSTVVEVHCETAPREDEPWPDERFGPLVGRSAIMRNLFRALANVSGIDAPVFIQGETGTGKELVARAIHEASPRAKQPFVVVDCAALPEGLLDAELFGHTKGAFTGAQQARAGAFEAAHGGTVFLDEIGELPLSMQPKLLRALESKTIRRVGETQHRPIDVRFVAATHRDLAAMVNEGTFREDLYFRLAVLPVAVPALRERTDDIELLVDHFLPQGAEFSLEPELIRELSKMPWRGNVRELRNFVDRLLALGAERALEMTPPSGVVAFDPATGATIPPASRPAMGSLSAPPREQEFTDAVPAISGEALAEAHRRRSAPPPVPFDQPYRAFREQWVERGEREYVSRLLERHERNVPAAAEEAGVDRTYIYRLIRRHEL